MNEELLGYLKSITEAKDNKINWRDSYLTCCEKEPGSNVVDRDKVIGPGRLMDMYCQPLHEMIPDHSHNFVELVYMYSGSTVHVINKTRILLLETNDLLLLRQGTSHAVEPAGENDIAVHFFLMPEFFFHPGLMEEESGVVRHLVVGTPSAGDSGADYLHFHLKDILPARNLMENMIWSFSGRKKGRQEINQATMGILLMELIHETGREEPHDMAQYEEQMVLTAYQYLESNYPSATLEEFSALAMQPSYYISRLFKRYFRMTFTECLQLIRMIRAANYLASTSKPVEEIIAEIGYENSSYFHRLFKERYGMTPKQFRDKSRDQI
ncbi:AraC family transcriptional regulator [Lachnospiraceae bacterium 54-53]